MAARRVGSTGERSRIRRDGDESAPVVLRPAPAVLGDARRSPLGLLTGLVGARTVGPRRLGAVLHLMRLRVVPPLIVVGHVRSHRPGGRIPRPEASYSRAL